MTPPPVALEIIVATGLPSWFTVAQKVMFNSLGNVGSGVTRRGRARWQVDHPWKVWGKILKERGKEEKGKGEEKEKKREKRGKEKGENVEEKGENVKEKRNCKRRGGKLNTWVVKVLTTPVGGQGGSLKTQTQKTHFPKEFFDQTWYISRLL